MHETIRDESLPAAVGIAVDEPFVTKDTMLIRLFEGVFEHMGLMVVFAADEDIGLGQSTRIHTDGDTFEQQVRFKVKQQPILESARLGLIRVDCQVPILDFFTLADLGQEGPLEPGWETGTASPAQVGRLDLVGHFVGLHGQGFAQPFIPPGLDILVVGDGVPILRLAKGWGGNALAQHMLVQGVLIGLLGHGSLAVSRW